MAKQKIKTEAPAQASSVAVAMAATAPATPAEILKITSRAKELRPNVSIDQLHVFTFGNPRAMEEKMQKSLSNSLKEFGKIEPIVVRASKVEEGKFEILNGHHRFDELKKLGETVVDILIVDLPDDKQARALVLALNRISADWNYEELDNYVGKMIADGIGRDYIGEVTGFPTAELDQLAKGGTEFLDEFLTGNAADGVPATEGHPSRAKVSASETQDALDAEHVTFSAVLLKVQNEIVHNAMKAFKAKSPGTDSGAALAGICELYLKGVPTNGAN